MSYLIVFIYILGVFLSPYWLDFVEDYDEFTRLVYPWIWPIWFVFMIFAVVLYLPEIISQTVKDKKNDN